MAGDCVGAGGAGRAGHPDRHQLELARGPLLPGPCALLPLHSHDPGGPSLPPRPRFDTCWHPHRPPPSLSLPRTQWLWQHPAKAALLPVWQERSTALARSGRTGFNATVGALQELGGDPAFQYLLTSADPPASAPYMLSMLSSVGGDLCQVSAGCTSTPVPPPRTCTSLLQLLTGAARRHRPRRMGAAARARRQRERRRSIVGNVAQA